MALRTNFIRSWYKHLMTKGAKEHKHQEIMFTNTENTYKPTLALLLTEHWNSWVFGFVRFTFGLLTKHWNSWVLGFVRFTFGFHIHHHKVRHKVTIKSRGFISEHKMFVLPLLIHLYHIRLMHLEFFVAVLNVSE